VNEDSYSLIADLIESDLMPDFITIDIAHGHCEKMEKMIKFIKTFGQDSLLICGNICTSEAASDLENWGADCLKIGIDPGEVCTTYQNTSFGSRGHQASTVLEISKCSKLPLIADGGIRKNGDINVALSMGASMIMIGGMLSGFEDSPGNVIYHNGIPHKEFWGSASQYQSSKTNRIEGTKVLKVLKNRSLIDELISLEESIQSGISYAGGKNILAFKGIKYHVKN
jgi:GMP reductase